MAIQKTIENPASRRITLDIPMEVPLGQVILTFTPISDLKSVDADPSADLSAYLAANSPSTIEEALAEAERKFNDPNRKPISSFWGTVKGVYGDGVAYQRKLRDEWD